MATTEDNSLESEFKILHARSVHSQKAPNEEIASTPDTKKSKKKSTSRQNAIKCQEHEDGNKNSWTSLNTECDNCTRFLFVEELKESQNSRCS